MSGTSALRGDINFLDEGQFAAWVNQIFHGEKMYRDFFTAYGPLQIYPVYLSALLFGKNMFSIRLGAGVLQIFLGIGISILVLKTLKVHPVLEAVTLFLILLIPGVFLRQWIGIFCILLTVEAFTKRSKSLALLSGSVLALSFLESVDIGALSLFTVGGYIGYISAFRKNPPHGSLIKFFILGVVLIAAIFAFFAQKDGWLIFYFKETIKTITSDSGINLANGMGLPAVSFERLYLSPIFFIRFIFSKAMLFYWALLYLLILLCISIFRFFLGLKGKENIISFLAIFYSILWFGTIIGRSGHYPIVIPIILVFSSYYLSQLFPFKKTNKTSDKIMGLLFLGVVLGYGLRYMAIYRFTDFPNIPGRKKVDISVSRVSPLGISKKQADEIKSLQEFFAKETKQGDTIFVLNNEPAIYFLVDREDPTAYGLPFLAYSKSMREDIVSALSKRKTQFVVEDSQAWAVDGISDSQRLPEVVSYVNKSYREYKMLGHYVVYKRI